MSELRSLLDQLAAADIGQMSVEMLDEDIDELVHGRQMMDVLLAQRVRGMTDRGGHVELGFPSPTAYLTGKGMSVGRARRQVIRAYASDNAPGTSRAWSDGRLSTDQAELLIRVAAAVPDQFPEAEDRLVEIVEPLSVTSTAKAVEYWRQSVDGPGDLSLESQHVRRGVSLSTTFGGMRRLDGWMTSTAGEALETALNALTSPPTEDDTRTPRQRRHDALEDLARGYLDHGETPTVGGQKPHITVITDASGRLRNDGPSSPATVIARHPHASDPQPGVTSITSPTGQTKAPPVSIREPSSAGSTIRSSTSEPSSGNTDHELRGEPGPHPATEEHVTHL